MIRIEYKNCFSKSKNLLCIAYPLLILTPAWSPYWFSKIGESSSSKLVRITFADDFSMPFCYSFPVAATSNLLFAPEKFCPNAVESRQCSTSSNNISVFTWFGSPSALRMCLPCTFSQTDNEFPEFWRWNDPSNEWKTFFHSWIFISLQKQACDR